ncbi:hypothetical protein RJ640_005200, partial [Escallonia rubra]
MAATTDSGGVAALHRLKSTDPPLYLSPSPDLSHSARLACQHLFASLRPFTPKSPFDRLLTDGFDAEQIWQQIDLQSQPLISTLRREVKIFEKHPEEIAKLFPKVSVGKKEGKDGKNEELEGLELDGEKDEGFDELEDGDEGLEGSDDVGDEEDDEEEERESEEEGDGGGAGGVEDRFLKIRELEEYLEDDEAREYGIKKKEKGDRKVANGSNEEDDDDDDEDEEDGEDGDGDEEGEEDDDELGVLGLGDGDDEEGGDARYKDFFGGKKKTGSQQKKTRHDSSAGDKQSGDMDFDDKQKKENRSTHEKQLEKQCLKIEEMEKANMEVKTWTMQGEVTAAKRPKNSALEVDLDFEHNVRPAPVITEEVTASLEELIQKRILEGRFDDVFRAPTLLNKAPKERKELDENKSNKGLAEVYADEYAQKTGLVSSALTFSDEQKKEASVLFKKLCLKLDALSHFHFTPKPVIEDMTIQANVPALAMEEIAPLAVSDAAMLAPEEVFAGKGDVKEEAELTQAERKRRRANKKRKYK